MLRLTPQQVGQVTGLTDQTLRHWRRVLPPLEGLNGYTACFTPGDALALLVLRHLVKVTGINIAALAGASTSLFGLCRNTSWPQLADRCLLIQVERGEVNILNKQPELDAPAIMVPMRSFAEQLQAAWASSFPQVDQLPLQFPTSIISPTRRTARS